MVNKKERGVWRVVRVFFLALSRNFQNCLSSFSAGDTRSRQGVVLGHGGERRRPAVARVVGATWLFARSTLGRLAPGPCKHTFPDFSAATVQRLGHGTKRAERGVGFAGGVGFRHGWVDLITCAGAAPVGSQSHRERDRVREHSPVEAQKTFWSSHSIT